MSRMPRAGGRYVAPVKSDGSIPTETEHGKYALEASATYYYVLGGVDAPFLGFHLTGYTATAVITSGTVQDSNHHGGLSQGLPPTEGDVTDISTTVGEWMTEDPTSAFVAVDGTGWSVSNGVIAASGAGAGGAYWHIAETSAARTRIAIVMGVAGGVFRGSSHGKD